VPFTRTRHLFNKAKRGCTEGSIKDNKCLRDGKGAGQSFSSNFGMNFFIYDVRQAESRREVSRDESVVQRRGVANRRAKGYVVDKEGEPGSENRVVKCITPAFSYVWGRE